MIKAITHNPAITARVGCLENDVYSSDLVTASALLAAIEALKACGPQRSAPHVQINHERFTLRELHKIASTHYRHFDGCDTVQACSDVLAHVASATLALVSAAKGSAAVGFEIDEKR